METLLEIQEKLKEIAKNSNITGPAIDALILLLSESVYRGQLGNVTELLERSFSRCRMLNSAITHSFDRCYSVFRGRNQMFRLVDVLPISNMSVKKFDIAVDIGSYKLVYADNYHFESMVPPSDVKLILCDSVLTKESTIDTFDLFKVTFNNQDISESIAVYRDNLGDFTETEASRVFADSVKGMENEHGTYFPLWIGTRENFGVSIVAVNETSKFKPNEKIRIKYLRYLDKTISPELIPSIPGFMSTIIPEDDLSSTNGETSYYNFEDLGIINREISISEIFKNANSVFLTQGVIKSYNDIENVVWEKYGQSIGSLDVDFDFTTHINPITNEPDPVLFISYTDKTYTDLSSSKLENIPTGNDIKKYIDKDGKVVAFEILDFTNEMKKSYYIDEDIYFVKPKKIVIPDISLVSSHIKAVSEITDSNIKDYVASQINGEFKVIIYYTGLTTPSISSVIEEYNNTFNPKLNLSEFIASVQRIDGVKFAELYVSFRKDENEEIKDYEFPLISIDLSEKEYTSCINNEEDKRLYIGQKKIPETNFTVEYRPFDRYFKSIR